MGFTKGSAMITIPAVAAEGTPIICTRVRTAREAAGLTQRAVAARLGIAEKTYAFYERSREPKPARLREIADAIGVDYSLLAAGLHEQRDILEPGRLEDMIDGLRDEIRRLRRDLGLGDQ